MKNRVCAKEGEMSAFFELDINLKDRKIILDPTLNDIQTAINNAAKAILRCAKKIYNWDQSHLKEEDKDSFYKLIATDKEIVRVILLLTGSIRGTKNKVDNFTSGYLVYKK
jgi:dynein heavy chain